ncbi:MAG: hypothetical protein KC766_28875 [Myxococcales bacterium]|nr:hypothetical protein [Myxococcales bacterium]
MTNSNPAGSRPLTRRDFNALGLSSLGVVLGAGLAACGAYPAETGDAYSPWVFPRAGESLEEGLIHAALLASSPHNTQPWTFAYGPKRVSFFVDDSRSLGAMDSLARERHIGLGCAVENLVVAAAARGFAARVDWLPDSATPSWVADVTLTESASASTSDALYGAISRRHTNRGAYLDARPPAALEQALRDQLEDASVELHFLSGARARDFRAGTIDATAAIVDDAGMLDAGHAWWRQTKREIEEQRDGLTLDASGLGALTRFLGKSTGRPSARTAGEYWLEGTRGDQTTGFAFCMLSTADRSSRAEQLLVGRAYQRLHLWATSQNLAFQPLNQMAERQDREETLGLASDFGDRLAKLSGQSRSGAQMLFRVGVPWDRALKSPRRPLAWVVT